MQASARGRPGLFWRTQSGLGLRFSWCAQSQPSRSGREKSQKWGVGVPLGAWNYERIWRPGYLEDITKRMREAGRPAMLVLDESHRIKDRTTKQSKASRKLGRLAQYRRLLTGTPVVNGQQDLWAQVDYLDSAILGKWSAFATDHLILNTYFPSKVEGIKNVVALHGRTTSGRGNSASRRANSCPDCHHRSRPDGERAYADVRSMTVEMVGSSPSALMREARRVARANGMRPTGAELVHETALTATDERGRPGLLVRRTHTGVVRARLDMQKTALGARARKRAHKRRGP